MNPNIIEQDIANGGAADASPATPDTNMFTNPVLSQNPAATGQYSFEPGTTMNGQLLPTDSYNMGGGQQPKGASPSSSKPKATGIDNNPIVRNLQNIGEVAGGILGTPADLISGVGGNVAGAAAGRGLGEFLKEGIESVFGNGSAGKKGINPEEIAKQAGIGALGQGIGELAGPATSKILTPVTKMGDKLLGRSLFGGATKASRIANDAASTAAQLNGYGIKAKDVPDAIAQSTGLNGILSNGVRRALSSAGISVDTADLLDKNGIVDQAKQGLIASNMNPAAKVLQNLIDYHLGTNLPAKSDASVVYDLMHNLESPAFKKNAPWQVRQAFYGVARELESRLENARGLEKDVGKLYTPDEIAALREISPKLADEAANITSIRGGRALQRPFVNASKMMESAAEQGEDVNQRGALGGLRGMADVAELATGYGAHGLGRMAALADIASRTPFVQGGLGRLLRIPNNILQAAGTRLADKPMLSKVLKTVGPDTLSGLNSVAGLSGDATGPVSSSVASSVDQANTQITGALNQNGANQTGGLNPQDFSSLMNQYGAYGLSRYMEYLQLTQPQLSSEQQTGLTLAQNSLRQLKRLSQIYDTSISQGKYGSFLNEASKLPSFISTPLTDMTQQLGGKNTGAGTAYNTYKSEMFDVARTISRLASEGGSVGGTGGISQIEKELPTLADSPMEAQNKFQQAIVSILQSAQSIMSAPATNTPGQMTNFSGAAIPGSSLPSDLPNVLNYIGA